MKLPAITPGPWHDLDIGDIVASDAEGLPDERILAFINTAPNDEDHEANAKAIAAVPALLEALLEALGFLGAEFGHISDPDNPRGWSNLEAFEVYGQLIAALRLAGASE